MNKCEVEQLACRLVHEAIPKYESFLVKIEDWHYGVAGNPADGYCVFRSNDLHHWYGMSPYPDRPKLYAIKDEAISFVADILMSEVKEKVEHGKTIDIGINWAANESDIRYLTKKLESLEQCGIGVQEILRLPDKELLKSLNRDKQ